MSDIEKVKKLRSATGAGFKDCNSALKEASGDLDKAIEILRIKGISKAPGTVTSEKFTFKIFKVSLQSSSID